MSVNPNGDKNVDISLSFNSRDSLNNYPKPVYLFIKVCFIIILCESTTEALLFLLPFQIGVGILIEVTLLTALCTVSLYRVIVKPMLELLEVSMKTEKDLELFRGLLDKSNDAIFVIDPDTGKFIDVNYRACTMLGLTRQGFFIREAMEIEESMAGNSGWTERVVRIREKGYAFIQSRFQRGDGTSFPVEINFNFLNWRKQDYIVAVARDVSEQEFAKERLSESETKFRKLAQCAKNAMMMMGPKGEITFWNPAAEKMFGYSLSEAMGQDLHMLLMPERFREAYRKGFAGFQKTGKGYAAGKTIKISAIKKDGSEFNVEVTISPLQINGEWHAVGIVRGDSERKETEVDLIKAGQSAQ
jgi:PAS domain S-box-containing protein